MKEGRNIDERQGCSNSTLQAILWDDYKENKQTVCMKIGQAILIIIVASILYFFFTRSGDRVPAPIDMPEGKPLKEGDRVFVHGGYSMRPEWLNGRIGYEGTLERFIPGQNNTLSAVIRTDEQVITKEGAGHILIMSLRYEGASWQSGAVAHIELCDFEPDSTHWQDRRKGAWVEAAASIRHLEVAS